MNYSYKETPVTFGQEKSLYGIVTQNTKGDTNIKTAILMLNAGMLHRVGPNRLYVDMARQFSNQGLTSFRFDLSGFGDSPNSTTNEDYLDAKSRDVHSAMNHLETNYGIKNFVVLGICLGGDIAFHAALKDERINNLFLINSRLNYTSDTPSDKASLKTEIQKRYYLKNLWNTKSWSRLITGKSDFNAISKVVKNSMSKLIKPSDGEHKDFGKLPNSWQKILDRNVGVNLLYSEGSLTYDSYKTNLEAILKNSTDTKLINVEIIEDTDHVFTLKWSQTLLIERTQIWMNTILN